MSYDLVSRTGRTETQSKRQERVLTQVITKADHTTTFYVTLGSSTPTHGPTPSTFVDASAIPPSDAHPESDSRGHELSQAAMGGILGGVVALMTILLVVCFCLSAERRRQRRGEAYYYGSDPHYGTDGAISPRWGQHMPQPPHQARYGPREPRLNQPPLWFPPRRPTGYQQTRHVQIPSRVRVYHRS